MTNPSKKPASYAFATDFDDQPRVDPALRDAPFVGCDLCADPSTCPASGSPCWGISGMTCEGRRQHTQHGLELVARGASRVGLHQCLPQTRMGSDRKVGRRVDPAGNARIDLPQRDLVGHEDRRLQTGPARLLHVVGWRMRIKPAPQHRLPHEVPVSRMLLHGSTGHLSQSLPYKPTRLDQPPQRIGQHVLIAEVGISRIRASEGNPFRTNNGNFTETAVLHGKTLSLIGRVRS
ncbi:MAG: hypothetical protein R3B91_06450 [Planctomycetaceae bacterium]